jgi:hypothetical protein
MDNLSPFAAAGDLLLLFFERRTRNNHRWPILRSPSAKGGFAIFHFCANQPLQEVYPTSIFAVKIPRNAGQ